MGHICDLHDGGALREVRTDVSGSQIRGRLVISVTTAPRGPGRFVLGATSNRKLRLRFDGDLADAQGFGPNLLVQVAPDVSQCGCASGEPPGSYVAYVRMCNSKLDQKKNSQGGTWLIAWQRWGGEEGGDMMTMLTTMTMMGRARDDGGNAGGGRFSWTTSRTHVRTYVRTGRAPWLIACLARE